MAYDPRTEYGDYPPRREKSGPGCLMWLGIGCGVMILLVIIAGFLIWWNFKTWFTNLATSTIVEMVEQSNLPPDQKAQIKADVQRLAEDYKAGRITNEQLARVADEVADSPLLPLGAVYYAEEQYIGPSGLSEEEKEDARLQLERFARGVYEKKISQEAVNEVIAPVSTAGPDGKRKLKEKATDEEVRQMVAAAKQHADQAEIPEERFEVNIAEEFRKAIDRALNPAAAPNPAPDAEPAEAP